MKSIQEKMTEIMTLREFEQAIDEWGNNWGIETQIEVGELWTNVYANIYDEDLENPSVVAMIFNEKACVLNFARSAILELGDGEIRTLFKIVTKFANTWPADRQDKEKKYLLRHRFLGCEEFTYLNFRLADECYTIWTKTNSADYKTQFTMKEIEDLKMLYDTDLKDFELIEVEGKLEEKDENVRIYKKIID